MRSRNIKRFSLINGLFFLFVLIVVVVDTVVGWIVYSFALLRYSLLCVCFYSSTHFMTDYTSSPGLGILSLYDKTTVPRKVQSWESFPERYW
jgi:hypothetical protein